MLHHLIQVWFQWVKDWEYAGVFILMAMESSIFPVPSEIVMPPAAFWAAQGKMNFWGVVLAGTSGSWFGSSVTYWVARVLGFPFIDKFGKYFFLKSEKIKASGVFVEKHGAAGLFFARLLPVVRHLISIPAGVYKMPFGKFSLITTVGAGLWCFILSWFGEQVIGQEPGLLDSPEQLAHVMKKKLMWFIIAAVIFLGLYFVTQFMMKNKNKTKK
jgi:membrane protein DedA with SNARE-associated domain